MIYKKLYQESLIYNEFDETNIDYWFDRKREKFLHNVDTFYYSVFLDNDFTSETTDKNVIRFRHHFNMLYRDLPKDESTSLLDIADDFPTYLQLRATPFEFYTIHLCRNDYYDIFIAPSVPNDETSSILVQIRSKFLWTAGVVKAYEESYKDVEYIVTKFGMTINKVQENRCDYCWHTNYFHNPYPFLNIENIAKLRISRLNNGNQHFKFKGDEDYEIDYFSLGKRASKKIFFRLYLKSKEVIEMNYKPFFLKLWLLHGLINRYDLYVYESMYKKENKRWEYMDKARLEYYLEFGQDAKIKNKCAGILDEVIKLDYDALKEFADSITPPVTLILNVEFCTQRKFSRSLELLPIKNNTKYGVQKRIFDYFDNRPLICEYLTNEVLRFVNGSDENKSRRPMIPFWVRLRQCRLVDCKLTKEELSLVRTYDYEKNKDKVKHRALSSIVTYNIYEKGNNNHSIYQDSVDFMNTLNDNDFYRMSKLKAKRIRQIGSMENQNENVLSDAKEKRYKIVDTQGDVIENYSIDEWLSKEDFDDED